MRLNEIKEIINNESEVINLYQRVLLHIAKAEIKDFQELSKWLKGLGFEKKPASLKYHGNYYGGLLKHSMAVALILDEMTKDLGLQWERCCSPFIVGLFHDLCKCDDYALVSNGFDGSSGYGYNVNKILSGHGEKSVIMVQQHFKLTDEELYCIRWHMGAFDDKENWNAYGEACRKYPNILFTHTADMVAAKVLGV